MSSPESRRHFKQRRKESSRAAKAEIANMSDADLKNMAFELGREIGQQAQITNELRIRLDAVRNERERRRTATEEGISISDHAVLRYLERHKGVDVKVIRAEIVEMARRAGKFDSGNGYARRVDGVSGLTMGLDEVRGVVTTVFVDRESAVMDVPKRRGP